MSVGTGATPAAPGTASVAPGAADAWAAGDPRLALGARGVLGEYNRAGVLVAADVHVAQRLAELTGEQDGRVVLAVALAVRALRQGAVCVALADRGVLTTTEADETALDLPWYEPQAWAAAIEASRMVAVGPVEDPADVRPARWVGGRLYLDRYWRDEQLVRAALDERLRPLSADGGAAAGQRPGASSAEDDPGAVHAAVSRLFPAPTDDRQRLAAATAALSRVTVLTGGPGTGKTTTVATLLAALQEVAGGGLRIALAAPTGKAAARLQESVHAVVRRLPEADRQRVGDLSATTVHRLLGWRSATRFRHDRTHRLPHDVVVVDETSMVSLPLMARLLEALRPQARLVLVGDPDQLASVEAGAVLGDLVARPPAYDALAGEDLPTRLADVLPDDVPTDAEDLRALRNGVVRLTRVHRYDEDSALADLAEAIRRGDADAALAVLRRGAPGVELVDPEPDEHGHLPDDAVAAVRADVVATGTALVDAARAGDAAGALAALEGHRLLVAHRRGPAGVSTWADRAERWVAAAVAEDLTGPWPLGLPLLVTTNDRDTGLSNGDTGVVVDDGAGGRTVAFGEPTAPRLVRPHRLPPVQVVHAMTVHRGQGSQFRRVSVVLPPATSPLLTRELLYTAVTRAREHVRVVGTEEAIRAAVRRPIRRASGLREPLPGASPR